MRVPSGAKKSNYRLRLSPRAPYFAGSPEGNQGERRLPGYLGEPILWALNG